MIFVGCKGKEMMFDIDEYVCYDVKIEDMLKLCLVFKKDGVVIVGNVFGLNDGVVVFMLMLVDKVKDFGVLLFVKIRVYGIVGVDFVIMGIGFVFVMCIVM